MNNQHYFDFGGSDVFRPLAPRFDNDSDRTKEFACEEGFNPE